MQKNKRFDIIAINHTNAEHGVTIQVGNQPISMALETIGGDDRWIFNAKELGWIYEVWPEAKQDELFYNSWGCAFFARLIWTSKIVSLQLPIRNVDLDVVATKLQNGQTIKQIFHKYILDDTAELKN